MRPRNLPTGEVFSLTIKEERMTAVGVREVQTKGFQCVLCQTVYPSEEEAASCYRLCVEADKDPVSKLPTSGVCRR